MKLSKISYKNKNGKMVSIDLQRKDGTIYDIFFIYGPPGCGKTHLCKLISDAWQVNLFHGENPMGSGPMCTEIQLEGSFNDMQPISFGIPSKLTTKNIIRSKVSIENEVKNSILYYPWNRHTCVDSNNCYGEILTNAYLPLADMQDNSIQNCCLVIDNATRGFAEKDVKEYIQELHQVAQKHNNQVIMFLDSNNCGYLSGNNRSFSMEEQTSESIVDRCKNIIHNIKTTPTSV